MSSPDPYTPPSYRGALVMLVVIVLGVAVVWLAYSNALNTDRPDVPPPTQEQPAP